MSDDALHERIMKLEVHLAYQADVIATLDEVVREFASRVERVERKLAVLADRHGEAPVGPADDPPPHY